MVLSNIETLALSPSQSQVGLPSELLPCRTSCPSCPYCKGYEAIGGPISEATTNAQPGAISSCADRKLGVPCKILIDPPGGGKQFHPLLGIRSKPAPLGSVVYKQACPHNAIYDLHCKLQLGRREAVARNLANYVEKIAATYLYFRPLHPLSQGPLGPHARSALVPQTGFHGNTLPRFAPRDRFAAAHPELGYLMEERPWIVIYSLWLPLTFGSEAMLQVCPFSRCRRFGLSEFGSIHVKLC